MRRIAVCLALLLVGGPAAADVFGFETPSGNIDCSVGLESDYADIICTIHQRNGPPALPAPAGCTEDWGHIFELQERGPTRMVCQDKGQDHSWNDKASYGVTGRFRSITCDSSEKGFECRNADGHGFFLSRARQSVF